MQIDPNNAVIKLCARGMELEVQGLADEAKKKFYEAWQKAGTDQEKYVAAHYVARHQSTVEAKLEWDELALKFALESKEERVYPSLYLNIAKCHEDLKNGERAKANYDLAMVYANKLSEEGYGGMIKDGIKNGLARLDLLNDDTNLV